MTDILTNLLCLNNPLLIPLGSLAVATPQFREAVFGLGVGSIQISDVNCIGNETNLLNCSRQPRSCIHLSDAGVDCLGRPLRMFKNKRHLNE